MKFKVFLILVCIGINFGFLIPEKVGKKADKAIEKYFDSSNFSKENITISKSVNDQTPSDFSKNNLFKISEGDRFLGYGYVGNAPSKTATFDYLVLFDKDWIVLKSQVLIYREEYGGEIGSKRWLRQFDGSSYQTKELKYNQDIIPISGATISVRSMTAAMNDLQKSIGLILKEQSM